MRKNFFSKVLRTSAFATACLALAGPGVLADAITSTEATTSAVTTMQSVPVDHTYSTTGTIMSDGITGTNVISFNPVASGSFAAPSAVGLGEFVVSTLPAGQSTTYNDTHFSFTYQPVSIAGVAYPSSGAPEIISGVLNGTITGNQSSVEAKFDPITNPVFASADGKYISTLSILNNPLDLVPNSAGGRTTIQAQVVTTYPAQSGLGTGGTNPAATPEPTTLAILGTALVGLGLRKRLRKAHLAG